MEIEDILLRYVSEEILFDRDDVALKAEAPLEGVIDSLDVMRLVVFIEDEFHIRVADDDLVPENFESIGRLATLVRKKLREVTSAK